MEFFEVIENRRSIRRYKPEPVAREDVLKVIEAGRLAPSWKNGQCWHYLVVGDQKLKDKLGEITNNNPDVTAYQNAAYVIALCADPALSGNHNAQSYYLVDAGISMEQCVLAAADLGLGMCWTGIFDEPAVKKTAKYSRKYQGCGFVSVGRSRPTTQTAPSQKYSRRFVRK